MQPEKIDDYLLNAAHPDNNGKAELFETFGFHSRDWGTLARAMCQMAAKEFSFPALPGFTAGVSAGVISTKIRLAVAPGRSSQTTPARAPGAVTTYSRRTKPPGGIVTSPASAVVRSSRRLSKRWPAFASRQATPAGTVWTTDCGVGLSLCNQTVSDCPALTGSDGPASYGVIFAAGESVVHASRPVSRSTPQSARRKNCSTWRRDYQPRQQMCAALEDVRFSRADQRRRAGRRRGSSARGGC